MKGNQVKQLVQVYLWYLWVILTDRNWKDKSWETILIVKTNFRDCNPDLSYWMFVLHESSDKYICYSNIQVNMYSIIDVMQVEKIVTLLYYNFCRIL